MFVKQGFIWLGRALAGKSGKMGGKNKARYSTIQQSRTSNMSQEFFEVQAVNGKQGKLNSVLWHSVQLGPCG